MTKNVTPPKTEGERLLRELCDGDPGAMKRVAEACGQSYHGVRRWRFGSGRPLQREQLDALEELGIPSASWGKSPSGVVGEGADCLSPFGTAGHACAAEVAPVAPAAANPYDALSDAIALVEIAKAHTRSGLDPRELVKAIQSESAAIGRVESIMKSRQTLESRIVHEHPEWARIKAIAAAALAPYPDAARAWAKALLDAGLSS